jgi:hypothetical protein
MKAEEAYHFIKDEVIKNIYKHDDQIVAIANWVEHITNNATKPEQKLQQILIIEKLKNICNKKRSYGAILMEENDVDTINEAIQALTKDSLTVESAKQKIIGFFESYIRTLEITSKIFTPSDNMITARNIRNKMLEIFDEYSKQPSAPTHTLTDEKVETRSTEYLQMLTDHDWDDLLPFDKNSFIQGAVWMNRYQKAISYFGDNKKEPIDIKAKLLNSIKAGTHKQFIYNNVSKDADKNVRCRCGCAAIWWRDGYICGSITARPCKYNREEGK